MAGTDRSRRIAFEEQANLFDETATGYPAALIDDILALANLPPDGTVLEIGCGSGQATVSFAERGCTITAIELGKRLAQMAEHKLRNFPNARVIQHEFESWSLPKHRFSLVIAADSFHWIVPEVGLPKIAQLLTPGGMVALFWNLYGRSDTPLHQAIAEIYARIAPDWPNPLSGETSVDFVTERMGAHFQASGGFQPLQVRLYTDVHRVNTQMYLKELRTFSPHREMPDATRQALYREIATVFAQRGGALEIAITHPLLYTYLL